MDDLDQRGQDIVGYLDSIADDEDDWGRYAEQDFGYSQSHLEQFGGDFGKEEFEALLKMTQFDQPDVYNQITGDYYRDVGVEIEEYLDLMRTKAALASEQADLEKIKSKLEAQEAKKKDLQSLRHHLAQEWRKGPGKLQYMKPGDRFYVEGYAAKWAATHQGVPLAQKILETNQKLQRAHESDLQASRPRSEPAKQKPPPLPDDTPETVMKLANFEKNLAKPDFATLKNVARLYTLGSLGFPRIFVRDKEHPDDPFISKDALSFVLEPDALGKYTAMYNKFKRDFFGGGDDDIPALFKAWQELGKTNYMVDYGVKPEDEAAFAQYIDIDDLGIEGTEDKGWDQGEFRKKWEKMVQWLGNLTDFVTDNEDPGYLGPKTTPPKPPSPSAPKPPPAPAKSPSRDDEKQGEVQPTDLKPLDTGYAWKRTPPGWVVEQMRRLYKTDLFLQFARGPGPKPVDHQTQSFARDLHYDIMIGLIMGAEKPPSLARYKPSKAKFHQVVSQYTDEMIWGDSYNLPVILDYYFKQGVIERRDHPQSTVRGWIRGSRSMNEDFSKDHKWMSEPNSKAWVRAVKRYQQRHGDPPAIVTPKNWVDLFQKQTSTLPAVRKVSRKRERKRDDTRGRRKKPVVRFEEGTKPAVSKVSKPTAFEQVQTVYGGGKSYGKRKETILNYKLDTVMYKSSDGFSHTFESIFGTLSSAPELIANQDPQNQQRAVQQIDGLVQRLKTFYETVANGTFQKKQWQAWQATSKKLTPKFNLPFIGLFNRIPEEIMKWEFRPSAFSEEKYNARLKTLREKVGPSNKKEQDYLIAALEELKADYDAKPIKLPPPPGTPKKAPPSQIKVVKKRPRTLSLSLTPESAPKTKTVKVAPQTGKLEMTLHTPTKKPKPKSPAGVSPAMRKRLSKIDAIMKRKPSPKKSPAKPVSPSKSPLRRPGPGFINKAFGTPKKAKTLKHAAAGVVTPAKMDVVPGTPTTAKVLKARPKSALKHAAAGVVTPARVDPDTVIGTPTTAKVLKTKKTRPKTPDPDRRLKMFSSPPPSKKTPVASPPFSSVPSTAQSYVSRTHKTFQSIMGDKNLGSPLKSFTIPSPTGSATSTVFTFNTQAAVYRAPIDRHVLVRLNRLLKPPRPGAPVIDSRAEQEAFGFRMKEWFEQNQLRFPIENMVGGKHRFGDWIRLNTHKKSLTFTVTRKAHNAHLTALMDFLKGRVPTVFKVYHGKTKLSGIDHIGELEPVVHKLLTRHAKIKIKIAW